jgi:hypothetical protein
MKHGLRANNPLRAQTAADAKSKEINPNAEQPGNLAKAVDDVNHKDT